MENLFTKAIENRNEQLQEQAKSSNWSILRRNALVDVLEENDIYVSEHMWDLLLFNIHNLYIENGKITYTCLGRPSKKVTDLLVKHQELIIANKDRIFGQF